MIKPEVLDAMVAAGCTAEQVVAAVKADAQGEDARAARKREADADRKRRSRANVTFGHADIAGQSVTDADNSDAPPSPKEIPQTPLEITPSPETAIAVSRKRATRLSADWQLPKPWGDEAVAEGLTPDEARSEALNMRDWSLSSPGGAKLDWHATWRIWFRKALKSRPQARGSLQPKASSSSALANSAARLAQSMRSSDELRSRSSSGSLPALIPHLPVR